MARQSKKRHPGLRPSWKEYFTLSYRVKRGLMVLFSLIFIEIVLLIYLHYTPTSASKIDVEKFRLEVDAFYASKLPDLSVGYDSGAFSPPVISRMRAGNSGVKPELFSFNPNHLPDSGWKRLGFTEKQIRSIKNYEAKGGTFKTKADVKKMYAIRESEFERIEPFIVIPGNQKQVSNGAAQREKKFQPVDIGTADTAELVKLPQVGDYLASKIAGYRDKLGGFYSIAQLREVRGMRDSSWLVISPLIILKDSTNLRRINLNTADYSELNRHPYIDNSLANIILNYRRQHGSFMEVEDLLKVMLVDAELYRKIAPYLKVD
jgi:competence protein ComEA